MITQEAIKYIKKEKEKGISDEDIRSALARVGWLPADIEEVFAKYYSDNPINITPLTSDQDDDFSKDSKKLIHKFPLKFKLLFITLLLLVLIVIAGLFFLKQSPAKVLSQVYENTLELQSFSYSMNANIHMEDNSSSGTVNKYSFSLSSIGSMESGPGDEVKSKQTVTLAVQNLLTTSFDLINYENGIYLKFRDFPDYGFISQELLTENWIFMDLSEYEEQLGQQESISEEQEKEINDFIKGSPIIEVKEDLGDDNLDGFDVYRYKYNLNKENLKNLIDLVISMQEGSEGKMNDEGAIEDLLDRVDFYDGEIYIDKELKLVRKMTFAMTVRLGEDGSESLTLDSVWSYTGFNEATKIEKPENALPLEQIYQNYLDDVMQETGTEVPSEFILPDVEIDPQGITFLDKLPDVLGVGTERE